MTDKPYILYAEDDLSLQLPIKKFLAEDFELKCVNYGSDCCHNILERLPDVIILGSCMPMYDGPELSQYLRAKKEYPAIPVISTHEKIAETDFDVYFPTPPDKESLVRAIKGLLKQ